MLSDAWRNRCTQFFQKQGRDDHELLTQLLEWIGSPSNHQGTPDLEEPFRDKLAADLDTLQSGAFGACDENLLTEDRLKKFCEYRETSRIGFLTETGPIKSKTILDSSAGCHLHDFGVITPTDYGPIRLGYPVDRFGIGRWFPSNISEALSNLIPSFWPSPFREWFVNDIANARHQPKNPSGGEQAYFRDREAELAAAEKLREWCATVLADAITESGDHFITLLESKNFYTRIITLYETLSAQDSIYVFSTTSGLVIKDQFLGSDLQQTDKYRPTYFDELRRCKGRVYYQLDPATTWAGPKGVLRSLMKEDEHLVHLASFLCQPNLEVSEADFNTPETRWRKQYTLTNSANWIAYSSRKEQVKKISNGKIATSTFWNSLGKNPFGVVRNLYKEQSQEEQIIKKMGESLTLREAMQRARDTFDRWRSSPTLNKGTQA